MDRSAVRILNVLLGNPESFAAIEMHFPGSEVMCESDCFLAFGGSEVSAELDGQAAAGWRVHKAAAGQTIRFRRGPLGNRAYLAAAGGLMPSIGLPAKISGGTHGHQHYVQAPGRQGRQWLSRQCRPP